MSLHYLSGDLDEVGATKKKAKKKEEKKAKKAQKKADKKAAGKGKPKKVAVIAGVAVRNAALAVIKLNAFRIAKKLARTYNKPGGKDQLKTSWTKLGGNFDSLKKAISVGAKEQLSGDSMGVALEATWATALPAIIILAGVIKKFGGGGDSAEASEFDSAINKGKIDLENNPDIAKGEASLKDGNEVGIVKDDEKTVNAGLSLNPATISCFLPILISMMISGYEITHPVLYFIGSLINTYCVIGVLFLPFAVGMFGARIEKIALLYFSVPAKYLFYQPSNLLKNGLQKILR